MRDAAMYEDEDAAEADRKLHDDEGNEGVDVDRNMNEVVDKMT